MTLGALVGYGRTAKLYVWGDGQVVKLYEPWYNRDDAIREARDSRAVYDAGVPTPATGDVVEVDGRLGIVFERLDGPSMLEALGARPWRIPRLARMLAEMQVAMHARTAPGLRPLKPCVASAIEHAEPLPPRCRDAALQALAAMPDGDAICHGDYHPDNVLLARRGPMIIDWPNAVLGSAWADVVRTSLLLQVGAPPPGRAASLLLAIRGLFHRIYLRRYLQLRPDSAGEMAGWWLPVAAARLGEHIPEEEAQVLAIVERCLVGDAVGSGRRGLQ